AHTCAIDDGGAVWCWGRNRDGQLGDGTTTDRAQPMPVTGLAGARALAAGGGHTCAIDDGGAASRGAPARVAVAGASAPATAIAAGEVHTCAVLGGEVWCWGRGDDGQ